MSRHLALAGLIVAGLARTVSSQSPPPAPPNAAAQCQSDALAFQAKRFADMRSGGTLLTAESVAPIQAEGKRMARECASRIAIESASPSELASLTSLYLFTLDTAKAKTVSALALSRPGMPETERANAMVAAVQLSIATFDPFTGINQDAERFVRQIDQLSDAVIQQKIRAHENLLGRYEYADNDSGIRDHAHKLLALARKALASGALGMTPPRPGVPSASAAYPAGAMTNVMVPCAGARVSTSPRRSSEKIVREWKCRGSSVAGPQAASHSRNATCFAVTRLVIVPPGA